VLAQPHRTRHSGGAPTAPRVAAPRQLQALEMREAYHRRLEWLEEQWQLLLAMLELRAPDRVEQIGSLTEQGDGGRPRAVAAARSAWRFLDMEARRDWLRICSEMFTVESTG
jgi:hypothetical protein